MINEVSPPGWGHTKAEKEKTKPEKPKSKIGGTAHAMKLAQKRGDIPKNMNIFALMWSMKNKGDKPHYKPGVKDKLKGKYKGPEGQNEMIDPKKIRNYKNVPNSVVAKANKEAEKVKDKEQKGTLEFPEMPTEESTEHDEMVQKVVEYIKTNGKRRKTAGGDGRRTENEATAAELELANAKKADKKQQGGSLKHKVWPASASEDVEIDELSKKVLGRYVKKAAHDTAGAGIDLGVSSQKKGGQSRKDVDTHAGKLLKRQRGIGKAVDKLSKEDMSLAPKGKGRKAAKALYKDEGWGAVAKAADTLAAKSKAKEDAERNKKESSWIKILRLGRKIKEDWKKLAKKHDLSIDIFGIDSLPSFSFRSKNNQAYKTLITQEMLKQGFLAGTSVYVSTEHSEEIVNSFFNKLDPVFEQIRKCEDGLDVMNLLEGPIAHKTFERFNNHQKEPERDSPPSQ